MRVPGLGGLVAHMGQELTHRLTAEIRAEAGRQNLSQTELAREAKLPVATVRRYFWTDEREPKVGALAAVAEALGLTASEMLRRAEDAAPVEVLRPRVWDAAPRATFLPPQPE